jgi:phosphopantothenoylcysteine decarboxylase/phosphopantothenate--cysteine ligase
MKGNPPSRPGVKPGPELNGRKILLGVCGGIAAYKAVELTRMFVKQGARVQVVMTSAAEKFVAPLTFETITGRHVFIEMFPDHGDFSPWHTEMATWPDLAVIAPATANHMARLAAGFADDLLTTIMLTLDRPRLLCPAMNHRMWANPATQDNLAVLKRRGFRFVMPEEGQMARPGEEDGIGRLADLDSIFREVSHMLSAPQDLRGVRVLVTGGRTEESWDPVRVLTNRSTGRMGFALAEEARERGADVVLIHGPTDVIPPTGVRLRRVTTAAEMASAVKQEYAQSKVVLMAAAVADYTFAKTAEHKIKKGEPSPEIQLVATEDILKSLAEKKNDRIVVGFALETENLLENALKKLRDKHLDIVVANNPLAQGSGFAVETNQVLIIHRTGRVTELPLQSKREAARDILNAVIEIYRNPEPEPEPEEVLLLDEEEDLGGLNLDGLEIDEDAALEERFSPQQPAPAHGQPSGQPFPQGDRNSRRHKKHRDRDRDRDRNKPHGPVPQPAPRPQETVAAHAPAPVVEHAPVPESQPVRPPVRPPVPTPVRQNVPERVAPPVAAESARVSVAETATDLPGSSIDSPAELPFPNSGTPIPGAPGTKKSRGRRGGRRAQRARAKRQAAVGGEQPVNESGAVQESPVIAAPQPVAVAPEPPVRTPAPARPPVPARKPAPAPRPPAARRPEPARTPEPIRGAEPAREPEPVHTPEPTRAIEPAPVMAPPPAPAVRPEQPSQPVAVAEAAPVAKAKPKRAKRTPAAAPAPADPAAAPAPVPRRKPAAKKVAKVKVRVAAENPDNEIIPDDE